MPTHAHTLTHALTNNYTHIGRERATTTTTTTSNNVANGAQRLSPPTLAKFSRFVGVVVVVVLLD